MANAVASPAAMARSQDVAVDLERVKVQQGPMMAMLEVDIAAIEGVSATIGEGMVVIGVARVLVEVILGDRSMAETGTSIPIPVQGLVGVA